MRQILFNSFLTYLTVKSLDKWLISASLTSVIPNMLGLFTACADGVVGACVRLGLRYVRLMLIPYAQGMRYDQLVFP